MCCKVRSNGGSKELFADIAEQYDITIEEMEVSPDHVHIFCSFPPRYSIAQVVTRFKSLSARAIFREFPGSSGACGVGNCGKMATLCAQSAIRSPRK